MGYGTFPADDRPDGDHHARHGDWPAVQLPVFARFMRWSRSHRTWRCTAFVRDLPQSTPSTRSVRVSVGRGGLSGLKPDEYVGQRVVLLWLNRSEVEANTTIFDATDDRRLGRPEACFHGSRGLVGDLDLDQATRNAYAGCRASADGRATGRDGEPGGWRDFGNTTYYAIGALDQLVHV